MSSAIHTGVSATSVVEAPGFAIIDLGYVGDGYERLPTGVSNQLHVLFDYPDDNPRVWHPDGEYALITTDPSPLSLEAICMNRDGTIGGAVHACLGEYCEVGESRAAIWQPGESLATEFPSNSIDSFEGVTAIASNGLIGGTIEEDTNSINTYWQSGQDQAILTIINTRLTVDQNDAFALGLKYSYYLYVEIDIAKARNAADSLSALFAGSSDQALKDYVQMLKDRAYAIPLSESTPFSAAEKSKLRQVFNAEFPEICSAASLSTEGASQ
jgi:hypothetical protein